MFAVGHSTRSVNCRRHENVDCTFVYFVYFVVHDLLAVPTEHAEHTERSEGAGVFTFQVSGIKNCTASRIERHCPSTAEHSLSSLTFVPLNRLTFPLAYATLFAARMKTL